MLPSYAACRNNSAAISTPANRWNGQNNQGYSNPKVDGLIDRLIATIDPTEQANLHFHAAQCLAFAGDAKSVLDALGHLKLSGDPAESPSSPLRWNDYVTATEAFLKGDLDALKAARERIAAGPKLDGVPANLDVVDRLIGRFRQPYLQAYLSGSEAAGRTSEVLDK